MLSLSEMEGYKAPTAYTMLLSILNLCKAYWHIHTGVWINLKHPSETGGLYQGIITLIRNNVKKLGMATLPRNKPNLYIDKSVHLLYSINHSRILKDTNPCSFLIAIRLRALICLTTISLCSKKMKSPGVNLC